MDYTGGMRSSPNGAGRTLTGRRRPVSAIGSGWIGPARTKKETKDHHHRVRLNDPAGGYRAAMKGRHTARDDSAQSPKRRAFLAEVTLEGGGVGIVRQPTRTTRGQTCRRSSRNGRGRQQHPFHRTDRRAPRRTAPPTMSAVMGMDEGGRRGDGANGHAQAFESKPVPKQRSWAGDTKALVAGSRGWRPAPWSMGSGGDAKSPLVVSMRESMVWGSKGGTRLWSQVQR
jgi:hypothetical protein